MNQLTFNKPVRADSIRHVETLKNLMPWQYYTMPDKIGIDRWIPPLNWKKTKNRKKNLKTDLFHVFSGIWETFI